MRTTVVYGLFSRGSIATIFLKKGSMLFFCPFRETNTVPAAGEVLQMLLQSGYDSGPTKMRQHASINVNKF